MIKGLVIFHKKEEDLSSDDYSVLRLLEAAKEKNIDLKVVTPNQFELVVTRDDRKSLLIDDKQIPLPDFVIPRMGSDTTYTIFQKHYNIYKNTFPSVNLFLKNGIIMLFQL